VAYVVIEGKAETRLEVGICCQLTLLVMTALNRRPSFTTNSYVPPALFLAFAAGVSVMSRLLITDSNRTNSDEFRLRVFWGASVVALLITALWNAGLAVEYIRAHSSKGVQRVVFAFALTTALVLGLGRRYAGVEGEKLLDASAAVSGADVRAITAVMNVVAATAIVLLLAAAAIVGTVQKSTPEELRLRAFHLRVLLFSSSLFLAIGVVEIYFLFSWPLQITAAELSAMKLVVDPTTARVIPTTAGALYTFLLVLIYAPAAVAHEERVSQVIAGLRAENMDLDVDKWRKANGLEASVSASFVSAFAVVTPALTAIGLPQLALS
jgi:hypothetical protein